MTSRELLRRLTLAAAAAPLAVGAVAVAGTAAYAAPLPLPAEDAIYYVGYLDGQLSSVTGVTEGTLDVSGVCADVCSPTPMPTFGGFYDAASDSIYVANGGYGVRFTLVKVPLSGPSAGTATVVGSDGSQDVFGMASGPDGAFAITAGGSPGLASVDLATGSLTPIGELGVEPGGVFYSFTYDRALDTYFLMERSAGLLYEVDVASGAATLVGDTGLPGSYSLMADGDGTLWNLDPASHLTSFTVAGTTIGTPVDRGSLASFATVAMIMKSPVPSYAVAYDGNGSDGGIAPVDDASPYLAGSRATIKAPGTLTRTGHQFWQWLTTPTWEFGVTHAYAPGETLTVTEDTTLYARWGGGPLEFRTDPADAAVTTAAFADTKPGEASSLTLYVRNVGAAPVAVSNVTGNDDGVSRTGGTCSSGGGSIQPYDDGAVADCTFTFTWTASSADISYPFAVNYFTSDSVTLTGTVASADVDAPTITGPARPPYTTGSLGVGHYAADEAVTWSLTGPDAARFVVDAEGDLTFVATPRAASYHLVVVGTDAASNVGELAVTVRVPAPAAPRRLDVSLHGDHATVRVRPGAPTGVPATSNHIRLRGSSIGCTVPAARGTCALIGLPERARYDVVAVAVGETGRSAPTHARITLRPVVERTTVFFTALSSRLGPSARARLARAVTPPAGGRLSSVRVVGYVQRSDSTANDRALSLARARAVARCLRGDGVAVPIAVRGRGVLGASRAARAAKVTLTFLLATQSGGGGRGAGR